MDIDCDFLTLPYRSLRLRDLRGFALATPCNQDQKGGRACDLSNQPAFLVRPVGIVSRTPAMIVLGCAVLNAVAVRT